MAVCLPVICAQMGSRDYYITKMSAFALSGQVSVASELSNWGDLTLNELYQRKLNDKRVEQDIAPYLANTPDRFFGSIIVWVLNDEAVVFEPVSDHVKVSAAYSSAANSMGFLILNSTRSSRESGLVALDGQHRLAALRYVVQGQTEGSQSAHVRDDEIAVIFVQDRDVRNARDLFTVLNRSARRVSKSDVLIMSEVDGAAIIARNVTSSSLFAPHGIDDRPLVKWERNTISSRDHQITTLNAIYEIAQIVADHLGIDLQAGEEAGSAPAKEDMDAVEEETMKWFKTFFELAQDFEDMRHDPPLVVDMRRKEKKFSLLMKPVGLIAFFGAVQVALDKSCGAMNDVRVVIERLLQVEWSIDSHFWKGIMVNAKGNVTNKKAEIQLASDLACWMITGKSSKVPFQQSLSERYRRQLGRNDSSLPEPIVIVQ